MTFPTHCPKCGVAIQNAPGIGPFCPNPECDIADGPFDGSPALGWATTALDKLTPLPRVTRIVLVDETGLIYERWNRADVQLSLQDDGRTLKVFCERGG